MFYVVKVELVVEPYAIQFLDHFRFDHNFGGIVATLDMKPQLFMTREAAEEACRDLVKTWNGAKAKMSVCSCVIEQIGNFTVSQF